MPCGNCLRVAFSMRAAQLRLHQAAGALGEQRLERDAVDDVERVDARCPSTSTSSAVRRRGSGRDVHVAERHLADELRGPS